MSYPENRDQKPRSRNEASAWSFTAYKDTEFRFAWSIENFSRKIESYDQGKKLESGIFKVNVEGLETSWRLACYPNGAKEGGSGKVGIYLESTDTTPLKTIKRKLTYSFELVDKEGSRICKGYKNSHCCTDKGWANGWGWPFVAHEKLKTDKSNLLPEDCFEVFCVMKFDGPEVTTSGASPTTNLALEEEEERGLMDLLETGVLADVEMVCEGRTFSCHKTILASKSSVFMATFCNDMKEKAMGKVNIEGIDQDTVNDMLIHVYGGKIEKLEDKAEELLIVADRYDLKQLKKSCEGVLARSLKMDNCLDYLILADRHSPDTLKPVIIKFIVENFIEVAALENFMEKLNNFSDVFQEVLDELASLRSKKVKKQTSDEEK